VVDNTTTCEGFFREIPVRSLVVCGDGLKDDLEACDDDNLLNSDGCNATCGIELGWTCAEFLPGTKTSKCTRAKVVFQPTSLLVSVEEGRQVH
jgi:cysteine-rich repeat protein